MLGATLGFEFGEVVGDDDGEVEDDVVGDEDGELVGAVEVEIVGDVDGDIVRTSEGDDVGVSDGLSDGKGVGSILLSSTVLLLSLFTPQPEKMDEPPPLGDISCLEDWCVGAIVGVFVLRTYSVG